MSKPKVAFICVHNSCRSQIAEAFGKVLAADVFESYSAGTETKPQINQDAVRLMKELYGIDMEKTQYSKLISAIPKPDIAISMGCNVSCPFIGRPFDENIVYRRVQNTIKLYAKQRRLAALVTNQIYEKEKNNRMMTGILSQIVEFRNGESGLHVLHINILTQLLLEKLMRKSENYDLSWSQQHMIATASALHDIGKIGIDEKILNKPGKLAKEEFEAMKQHTIIGARMLDSLEMYHDEEMMKYAYEICRWHHERYDGKGYPDGLKGEEIPISAQVVSLADVYDALVSDRVYKKAYSHEKAIEMILNGECGMFNPLLLECLVEIQDVLKAEIVGRGNEDS